MKKIILLLLLFPLCVTAQNLVLNGSFEDTLSCPNGLGQIDRAQFWYTTGGSTDYFNTCNPASFGTLGYQMPFQGNAYAGFITGNPVANGAREYAEGTLASPLLAGHCYQLSYYINSAHYNYTTDAIQAYFSDTLITGVFFGSGMLVYNPQTINTPGNFPDTLNWMLVQNYYVANGGEQYLIIGNFWDISQCTFVMINNLTSNSGSYMYIDSVSLIEVICTSIEEFKASTITVWPNPVSNILNIKTDINKNLDFIIYNSLMETCFKTKFFKSHQISVENFSSGIYYYQVLQDNEVIKSGKFIKPE